VMAEKKCLIIYRPQDCLILSMDDWNRPVPV
jgi:hypothetical protein